MVLTVPAKTKKARARASPPEMTVSPPPALSRRCLKILGHFAERVVCAAKPFADCTRQIAHQRAESRREGHSI